MGIRMSKEQTWTVSWSSLVSVATALTAVWAFAAPIAQKAMAGEIQAEISKQLAPIQKQLSNQTAAQIVSLNATVKNLRTSITALRFKRDMCANTPNCWTVRDAEDLDAAITDLDAAQKALLVLQN